MAELMDRMDVARANSIAPPDKYFDRAQDEIKAGDYDFSINLTGN